MPYLPRHVQSVSCRCDLVEDDAINMNRASSIAAGLVILLFASVSKADTVAPSPAAPVASVYSDFFQLADKGVFALTVFGGGFRADSYATVDEGFQFEQSITNYVGVVGRVTGYQLFIGSGFDNPLDPGTGHRARYNFARLQGGLDFTLYPLTHFYFLGGSDLGDSSAGVIEGDFSSWLGVYSKHPFNTAFSASYDSQNKVTNSQIDLRMVALSGESYLLLAGASGAIYGGGSIEGLQGQGGPGFGGFYTPWQTGIDLQTGYGTAGVFGQISLYKSMSWRLW
jgi:hypothetical protein